MHFTSFSTGTSTVYLSPDGIHSVRDISCGFT
jgi:hypothetical protein